MIGVSRRAYAKHRGVAENAVRKAIAAGRISIEADGTIDIAKADAAWTRNTAPAVEPASVPPATGEAEQKPVPKAAVDVVRNTLLDAGLPATPEDGTMTFAEARTANEILKAQERQIKLDRLRGTLVDRAKAAELIFNAARQERDSWTQWPARVAALIAAELQADPHAVETALDAYVRKYLHDLANVTTIEFR